MLLIYVKINKSPNVRSLKSPLPAGRQVSCLIRLLLELCVVPIVLMIFIMSS